MNGMGGGTDRDEDSAAYVRRLSVSLACYTLLGFFGVAVLTYGAIIGDWVTFAAGLVYAWAIIFMLGSGQWMRGVRRD